MQLKDALKNVAILGAGGKMGRGIALLLLQEMALTEADQKGDVDGADHQLILIDSNNQALQEMRQYLIEQLNRYGEKSINQLREYYRTSTNLVSNEEIIKAFVDGAVKLITLETDPHLARDSHIIFEAVVEDVDIKVKILNEAKGSQRQFFFSNTSSIPISVLRKKTELDGYLIGFHFYNPPPIQRLVELIAPAGTKPEAKQLALDLAKKLNKVVVESSDVAGFIGNGHFMREVVFSCNDARELAKKIPLEEAVFLINYVTHDFLVRPMGIFQLMDYVGIDIVQRVLKIMRTYLHEEFFYDPVIDQMVEAGAIGGLNSDGTFKDGFFRYDKHKPIGVFSLDRKEYRPIKEWSEDIKRVLGPLPKEWRSWRTLVNDQGQHSKIVTYFTKLFESGTPGSEVAIDLLLKSKEISEELIRDGIAKNKEDVNTVLQNGFYHLYGADIPWFDFEHVIRSNICDV